MNYVIIDRERCKGCQICIEVCPRKILSLEEKINGHGYHPAQMKPENREKCTGCAFCAIMCPDAAIEVEREDR
ncbi:MAG: ferredoxin family protein [Firmicutes bacterium]|jgi:2-oxoglutarate ferredoxin oxidoreductase subunit delta|nr:ferredoxin family protein [Bacillota bacterium]HOB21908.1 ferredoxin family protein [Bacillota bacterium]HQD39755.1 ferredoxin family protein [Bacillota bacterium]